MPNSHEEFLVILFRTIVFYRTVITGVFASYCRLLDQAVEKFQGTAKNFDEFVKKADRKE